jgi:predicted DNA-binding protein YlxM (UPF0122 family)
MQGEKVYTMSEAAKLLRVSRQTVYNKIDRSDLQRHLQDTEKGKVLSEEGFQILKSLLSNQNSTVNGQSNSVQDNKYIDSLIDSLKAENEQLSRLLSEQSKQIADLTRIVENSQVLLKSEQERNQLLLEAAQAPQEAPKGGFFSRVFRK